MAEQRVTEEQLTEWEGVADRLDRLTVPRLGPTATLDQLADQQAIVDGCNALRPLIADLRAARAEAAEWRTCYEVSDRNAENASREFSRQLEYREQTIDRWRARAEAAEAERDGLPTRRLEATDGR